MKQRDVIFLTFLCAAPVVVLPCQDASEATAVPSSVRITCKQIGFGLQTTGFGKSFSRDFPGACSPEPVACGFFQKSNRAVIATAPTRIVSTSPSITESLFALGLGPHVVGVSNFCQYPLEVSALPRVGSFLRPDAELIARLHPELVFINAGPNQSERQLASLGIRAITVSPGSLANVYSTIRTIGEAAMVSERADALIAGLRQRLDRVRASVAGRPSPRVLVVVGRRTGTLSDLVGVGGGSYLGELIGIAGGTNVLGGEHLPEYPRISMETVIRLAPDVVVDAADMGEALESRRRKQPSTLAMWQRETAIAAVQRRGVHVVTSDAFLVPGPRVVEAAETFAQWFHGENIR